MLDHRLVGLIGIVRSLTVLAALGGLLACGGGSSAPRDATPGPQPAYPAPWQRTETREACVAFDPLRQPFFGDVHVHTKYSADATIYGTKVGPRDAYAFAQGEAIGISDADEAPVRQVRLDRPLDFAAVTDHAEFFGEVDRCLTAGTSVYDTMICQILRQADLPDDQFQVTVQWLFPVGISNPPASLPFCDTPGIDCDAAAVSVWQEMQAAAEEAYDRTAACRFTTFIGYEHTGSVGGRHLHRNIIFRNEHVPPIAYSHLETAAGGIPQGIWTAIEDECLNAGTGCDAVIIPHNSNLSGGLQFVDPADAAEARRRQDREPLVEIHQLKGNSECRFDRLAGVGAGTTDELCTFEQLPESLQQLPNLPTFPIDRYPARNMVRNVLKAGLAFEQEHGVNPFMLGFIGGTDTHNATAGNVEEHNFEGAEGNHDATPERQIADDVRNNPGGLAVVWAEENSRDAVFAALRRRETYATSGTRPVVRFFAGTLDGVTCGAPDFVARAYETGAPMGGELGPHPTSPRFAVLALRDPGTAEYPGTPLQRVQIIKGWVDADGETHEAVFDVAGDADNGATVDPATCEPIGPGADELCAVWEDPTFDPSISAFYYVRVLENPSCRWSTRVCQAAGVDPFAPDCAEQAAAVGEAFANCCLGEDNDASLSPVVQERAWTSPIWYRPDGIASVEGALVPGATPAEGRLTLALHFGPSPGDPFVLDGLTLTVSDNDPIATVTVPPQALVDDGTGSLVWNGTADGGAPVTVRLTPTDGGGRRLEVEADPIDLGAADPLDHPVEVRIASGLYRAVQLRTWSWDGTRLTPAGG